MIELGKELAVLGVRRSAAVYRSMICKMQLAWTAPADINRVFGTEAEAGAWLASPDGD